MQHDLQISDFKLMNVLICKCVILIQLKKLKEESSAKMYTKYQSRHNKCSLSNTQTKVTGHKIIEHSSGTLIMTIIPKPTLFNY